MRAVEANGIRFAVREEVRGGERGLALCLHGFPESSYSWRHLLPVLADLGYRAWAPDLRGYGDSDKPPRVADYAIEVLIEDVVGLIHAAGASRATLLAHDWGAIIAWHVAMRRPEVVERLIVMNVPHPACLAREIRHGRQLPRLWYAALFQIPGLAERSLAEDGYRRIENAFTATAVHPDRFTPEDLRHYRESAAKPGALPGMLRYYRAYVAGGGGRRQSKLGYPTIEAPTLMVWGEHDMALEKATTIGTDRYVRDLTLRYVNASHWVQQDAPEVVEAMVRAWLNGERVPEEWELDAELKG
ncbi:MAG: alpha/beta hydrolase [Sandaracinaceae bacterium]